MRNYSSIQVSNETKYRLKGLALTRTESYENIILRILDVKLRGREVDYVIKDKNSEHQLLVKVDWAKQSQNMMYYDNDGDLKFDIPALSDDSFWVKFIEYITGLENLINIMAVLEDNEEIDAREVIIKRLT